MGKFEGLKNQLVTVFFDYGLEPSSSYTKNGLVYMFDEIRGIIEYSLFDGLKLDELTNKITNLLNDFCYEQRIETHPYEKLICKRIIITNYRKND